MRLIDCDSLFRRISREMDCGKLYLPVDFQEMIATEPTVEAEPVRHGRWFKKSDWHPISETATRDFPFYECTQCGWHRRFANDYNYCPHCGARMDGGDADD